MKRNILIQQAFNRILFFPKKFDLDLDENVIINFLAQKEIKAISFDLVSEVRKHIGKGKWLWGAKTWQAPEQFDCSSFSKYIFSRKGFHLPRRPIQQFNLLRSMGILYPLDTSYLLEAGDLVFTNGPYSQGRIDLTKPLDTPSHVFVAVEDNHLVSATNSEFGTGVTETSIDVVKEKRVVLGVAKIPSGIIFEFPEWREIETDEDIYYILIRDLIKKI